MLAVNGMLAPTQMPQPQTIYNIGKTGSAHIPYWGTRVQKIARQHTEPYINSINPIRRLACIHSVELNQEAFISDTDDDSSHALPKSRSPKLSSKKRRIDDWNKSEIPAPNLSTESSSSNTFSASSVAFPTTHSPNLPLSIYIKNIIPVILHVTGTDLLPKETLTSYPKLLCFLTYQLKAINLVLQAEVNALLSSPQPSTSNNEEILQRSDNDSIQSTYSSDEYPDPNTSPEEFNIESFLI